MTGHQRPHAAVRFDGARQAERLVAGLPVVARITRELALAGYSDAWMEGGSDASPAPEVAAEVRRLAGAMTVHFGSPPQDCQLDRYPGNPLIRAADLRAYLAGRPVPVVHLDKRSAAAEILRATGKASDGIVSRGLNRPISRRISALLLKVPGIRPIHAKVGSAVLGLVMFAALLLGTRNGLLAGAWVFQFASLFDGVDGEIARATYRTSRKGAALDSAVDAVTNLAAMMGLAINLWSSGREDALVLAMWGSGLLLLGLGAIGWRSLQEGGSLSFDGVKNVYRGRSSGPLAARMMRLATLLTSRDFCALVYLVLALLGMSIVGLYLFAVVTPVWVLFVGSALWSSGRRPAAEPAG